MQEAEEKKKVEILKSEKCEIEMENIIKGVWSIKQSKKKRWCLGVQGQSNKNTYTQQERKKIKN